PLSRGLGRRFFQGVLGLHLRSFVTTTKPQHSLNHNLKSVPLVLTGNRHQTMKNRILLENYFLPGDLEAQIETFVEHYNHRRYHESLSNVTPADAYFGRASAIIKQRERIKRQTIEHRRLQHRKLAA
ncbi:MAG: integrase core domain-containing protein, partial [Novosphingobium sp.]